MLKDESLEVAFDGFIVAEVDPEESARLRDKIRKEHSEKGDAEAFVIMTREMFVKRLRAWPYSDEFTDDNKRIFYKRYTQKANSVISQAEKLIKVKREELLGNLLTGVTGA